MIDQILPFLRCPFDPHRQTPLQRDEDTLLCPACAARFRIRNGIPVLVPWDAILPEGARHHDQLPPRHLPPSTSTTPATASW